MAVSKHTPAWSAQDIEKGLSRLRLVHRMWGCLWICGVEPFLMLCTGRNWIQVQRDACSPLGFMIMFYIFATVEVLAHTGLRIKVPWTDSSITILKQNLPNTSYESHRKIWYRRVPWPNARDRSLTYLQRVREGGDVWDPEWKVAAGLFGCLAFLVLGLGASAWAHFWLRRKYAEWYAAETKPWQPSGYWP